MATLSFLEAKKTMTPTEFTKYVQQGGELYYWEQGNFWVVTTQDLAKKVLTRPEFSADRSKFFISRMPDLDLSLIKDFFDIVSKMMVMSDAKEHSQRRRCAATAFSHQLINGYEEIVDQVVDKLLNQVEEKSDFSESHSFDFVEAVAKQLPSIILADLFGIPDKDRANFFKWSNNMTAFFGGASAYQNEDGIEVNKSANHLRDFFRTMIAEKVENPSDDFLSIVLQHRERFKLDFDELVSQAIMMLVAGQVTTTDQLGQNMLQMLQDLNVKDRLGQDEELLVNAIEEYSRLDPAVTFLFRVATQDYVHGDITIKAGDTVFISNHAVNRDPNEFENPHETDVSREISQHFAYGYGPHYCLGAKLARIQMKILYQKMLSRWPNLHISSDVMPERDHYSLAFSGMKQLELRTVPS